jgi:hypothetical protein
MIDKRNDDAIVLEAYRLAYEARDIVREAMAILKQMREEATWYERATGEARRPSSIVVGTSHDDGVPCGSDNCNGSHSASDACRAAS